MINHLLGEIYISNNLLKKISTPKSSLSSDFVPNLTDVLYNLVTSYTKPKIKHDNTASPEEIRQYIEDNSDEIELNLALWTAQRMGFVVSGSENFSQVTTLIGMHDYVLNRDLEKLFKLYKNPNK